MKILTIIVIAVIFTVVGVYILNSNDNHHDGNNHSDHNDDNEFDVNLYDTDVITLKEINNLSNRAYTEGCVCCGRYVIEGEMVCPLCKKQTEKESLKFRFN